MHLIPDDDSHLILDVGPGTGFDIEPGRILIGDERVERLDEVPRFVALIVDLTGALGYWVAMQAIRGDNEDQVTLRSAIAAWYQYDRLVNNGELAPELLKLPTTNNPVDIGIVAGWAGAGDDRAEAAVDGLVGRPGELACAIRDSLRDSPPAPRRPVLGW
jgi:hypothetical protein